MRSIYYPKQLMKGLLPVALISAFGSALGTFPGAAIGAHAVIGHSLLFGILWVVGIKLAVAAQERPRWSVIIAWISGICIIVISNGQSPVPRAGWTALALLPAWLALPLWISDCWDDARARWWGLRGCAGIVTAISCWALWARGSDLQQPVAMPLGHHNLLAVFLIPLLPLLWPLWSREGLGIADKADRIFAVISGAFGLTVIVETGSLAGAGSLLAMVLAGAVFRLTERDFQIPRRRWLSTLGIAIAATLAALASQIERISSILDSADISMKARWTYLEAGWRGFLERPWWGWGPGASHWTLAEHLRPIHGVHPPGQVVADLHCLPVQLLYELGIFGSIGGLIVVWAWWPKRSGTPVPQGGPQEQKLRRCGWVGLLGVGVFSLTGFSFDVPAILLALMPALSLALPANEAASQVASAQKRSSKHNQGRSVLRVGLATAAALALVVWQIPRDRAHLLYDRAVEAEAETAEKHLKAAHRLDPHFPLYPWRQALIDPGAGVSRSAAEAASGLSVLWLTAGEQSSDSETRAMAWTEAWRLNRLGATAAFHLAIDGGLDLATSIQWAERALRAEPLFIAAAVEGQQDRILRMAAENLSTQPDLDPYWRERILDLAKKRDSSSEKRTLGLKADAIGSESISLFAFRRRAWPVVVARVPLQSDLVSQVDLLPMPEEWMVTKN